MRTVTIGVSRWPPAMPDAGDCRYLSVATVILQAITSLLLVRRELGRRLRFEAAAG